MAKGTTESVKKKKPAAKKSGKKYLVIVESPAKATTIGKFLGSSYKIEASMGHIRDLPKSQLSIDIENDFEPKYITIRGKGELLSKLRRDAKNADKVFLATDPDREGEAISWHLLHALNLDEEKPISRITFNEITKTAVKRSISEARDIDMDLVDAQQARRVLDRLVGYTVSDLLWKKVKKGLSGGRVQSVALRLICDREEEINEFIPEEYWTLGAKLADKNGKHFDARFYGSPDKNGACQQSGNGCSAFQTGRAGFPCDGGQNRQQTEKARRAVYHQHHAAGGKQAPEHGDTENNADCTAAV